MYEKTVRFSEISLLTVLTGGYSRKKEKRAEEHSAKKGRDRRKSTCRKQFPRNAEIQEKSELNSYKEFPKTQKKESVIDEIQCIYWWIFHLRWLAGTAESTGFS